MKKILLFFIVLPLICSGQNPTNIASKETIVLSLDDFLALQRVKENLSNNQQPIKNAADADAFLFNLLNANKIKDMKIHRFLDSNNWLSDKKKAIIFLQHPLEIEKLKKEGNENDLGYEKLCKSIKSKKSYLKLLNERIINDLKVISKESDITDPQITSTKTNLETIKLIENSIKEDAIQLEALGSKYLSNENEFVQLDKTEHFIIYKDEEDNYSSYLYDVNNVLLVVLGGEKDLVNSTIEIENKKTLFEASLSDLGKLSTGLDIPIEWALDEEDDCGTPKPNDEIKVSFILLDKSKIKAPSTLSIKHEVLNENLTFNIHEKSYASFRVGVSASNIDKKQFILDSNNLLTIKPDETEQKEWKGNLIVMLEVVPWGRDYDRLDPIGFSGGRDIKNVSLQRLGLVLGLKLSSDPLETILGGFSYALSNSLALNVGVSFTATPVEVTNLPVGPNATLEYLRDNASREYKPNFFFGVSLTPSGMGKALGL